MNHDDNSWIRYSSLGIEMAVIIGLATWGGVSIDSHTAMHFPLFTILLSAVGLAIALIRLIRGVGKS